MNVHYLQGKDLLLSEKKALHIRQIVENEP